MTNTINVDDLQKALEQKAKSFDDLKEQIIFECDEVCLGKDFCDPTETEGCVETSKKWVSLVDVQNGLIDFLRDCVVVSRKQLQDKAKSTCELFKLINEEDPECQDGLLCDNCNHLKRKWISLDELVSGSDGVREKLKESSKPRNVYACGDR